MPTIESGVFYLMLVMAFGFLAMGFISKKDSIIGIFMILAMALFVGLGAFIGAGYGVVSTSTTTDGTVIWTETDITIPEGEDGYWFTWIFMGMAVLSFIMFIKVIWAPSAGAK